MEAASLQIHVLPPGDPVNYQKLVSVMTVGKSMVVVGVLTMCCAVTEMCFFDKVGWMPFEGGRIDYWSALLCIVAGSVGFAAGRNMHVTLMTSFITLCVLAAGVSLEQFTRSIRRTVFFSRGQQAAYICNVDMTHHGECPTLIYALMVTSACTVPMAALICALSIRGLVLCLQVVNFTTVAMPTNDAGTAGKAEQRP